MRILVTGAAGAVGSAVVKGMKDRYSLRGFDRVPMPDIAEAIVGDVTDFEAVLKATRGYGGGDPPRRQSLRRRTVGRYPPE